MKEKSLSFEKLPKLLLNFLPISNKNSLHLISGNPCGSRTTMTKAYFLFLNVYNGY